MSNQEYCTRIWGASDDLLEIDGALIVDEVNESFPYDVKCSDGTTAAFDYNSDGVWRCVVETTGKQFIRIVKAVGDDNEHYDISANGCSGYSDVLLVREPIAWVKVNKKYYRPTK